MIFINQRKKKEKNKLNPKQRIKSQKINQREKARKMMLRNLLMNISPLDQLKPLLMFKNQFKLIQGVGEPMNYKKMRNSLIMT